MQIMVTLPDKKLLCVNNNGKDEYALIYKMFIRLVNEKSENNDCIWCHNSVKQIRDRKNIKNQIAKKKSG